MEKGGMSGSLWLVCDTDSVAFSFYIKGGGEEIFLKKMLNQWC